MYQYTKQTNKKLRVGLMHCLTDLYNFMVLWFRYLRLTHQIETGYDNLSVEEEWLVKHMCQW